MKGHVRLPVRRKSYCADARRWFVALWLGSTKFAIKKKLKKPESGLIRICLRPSNLFLLRGASLPVSSAIASVNLLTLIVSHLSPPHQRLFVLLRSSQLSSLANSCEAKPWPGAGLVWHLSILEANYNYLAVRLEAASGCFALLCFAASTLSFPAQLSSALLCFAATHTLSPPSSQWISNLSPRD